MKKNTPYSKPEFLLELYRYMEGFEEKWQCKPSNLDFIYDGMVSSTSVLRYYLDRMVEFDMIFIPQIIRDGKKITPSRSIRLLPLSDAHPTIQKLIQGEKS